MTPQLFRYVIWGIAGCLMLLALPAGAQVNTEKYRTPKEVRGFAYHLEVAGTAKTGNAEEIEAKIDGRIDWRVGPFTTFFIFQDEYEWINGQRIINERLFHVRNIYRVAKKLQSEVFAQLNYDRKIRVDRRQLAGAGFRYDLASTVSYKFALSTAYMFEHERYNLQEAAEHPRKVNVSRWSNYISLNWQVRPGVEVTGVVYYQPRFDVFSDYRILSDQSLVIALGTAVSASVNFEIRYDSEPADGVEHTDTSTDFGIAVSF